MANDFHSPNLAALDARVNGLETVINRLMDIQEEQVKVNSRLEISIRLAQQAHDDFVKQHEKDFLPKLRELWDSRNSAQGGWSTIKVLGVFVVGAFTSLGVVLMFWEHVQHATK
jgi:hypothetical protein